MTMARSPVLLYDGLCGFCDRTVQFILRVNPEGVLQFAPLQGEFASSLRQRHSSLKGMDSLIVVELGGKEEQVYVRSSAVLRIAWYLGGLWRILGVLRVVPRPLRDWAYDLFARSRYQYFGRLDSCTIPSSEMSFRFLD